MSKRQERHGCSRRHFFKTAGAAGLAALLPQAASSAGAAYLQPAVPTRIFGNTGQAVSILSLGGTVNTMSNQLMLRQALRWGVTYWDTAHSYGGGRSEEGIGKYLDKYPQDRSKIFLVTKSGAWTAGGMTRDLESSLERMRTDVIDLFFVHSISDIDEMDEEMKRWAEKAKGSGKIRFFGFSTHSNMARCLQAAAKLGWIDGIMTTYNYRLMHQDSMRRAVDACVEAGIGLTAMKTQGGGPIPGSTEADLKLGGGFLAQGFTQEQAKLKAVWHNPQIASICSRMPNMTLLMANVAAAVDKTSLSAADQQHLQQLARETRSGYCAGCTRICEAAMGARVPIGDVMRCLMYARSYGDRALAVDTFRAILPEQRHLLALVDFAPAERRCPHRLPIGRLMREAAEELSG